MATVRRRFLDLDHGQVHYRTAGNGGHPAAEAAGETAAVFADFLDG